VGYHGGVRAAFSQQAIKRLAGILLPLLVAPLRADDIDGVQPAALDQPRINMVVRRGNNGPPLVGSGLEGQTFNVEAFLDTGAGAVVLSTQTADAMGIHRETIAPANPTEVRFQDVGIGGASAFAVSEPIFLSLAPMAPNVDVDEKDAIASTYTQTCGPLRAEIGPLAGAADWLTSLALANMDIAGMPVITGKIVVMDPVDVNNMSDKIRTYVYDPKTLAANPTQIPRTSLHVRLTEVQFGRFTSTIPASAAGPAMCANPMIGPDPFGASADPAPPVLLGHHGRTSSGTFLLDTGAAASLISKRQAALLGVSYSAAAESGDHPVLVGVPANRQFTLSLGGIGGMKKSAGFFLDKLSLPTAEGKSVTFVHAPVLVTDVAVKDASGKEFTLDGVFGMNFLVASAMVDESALLPDMSRLTPGAFRWIVIDQPHGWLGLERNP
jgi:hypothetical protein